MRKYGLLCLMVLFIFAFAGCKYQHPPVYVEHVRQFSYEEDLALYAEASSKVKREGFVNTAELESPIDWDTDAVERAARECPIAWDNMQTWFDPASHVWKVAFWDTKPTEGYPMYVYQTVYLSSKGMTLLIVYGE